MITSILHPTQTYDCYFIEHVSLLVVERSRRTGETGEEGEGQEDQRREGEKVSFKNCQCVHMHTYMCVGV